MLDKLLAEPERADQSVETSVADLENIESPESDKAQSVKTNDEDELKNKASNEKVTGVHCVFTLYASLRPKKGEIASGVSCNSHNETGEVYVASPSEFNFLLVSVSLVCLSFTCSFVFYFLLPCTSPFETCRATRFVINIKNVQDKVDLCISIATCKLLKRLKRFIFQWRKGKGEADFLKFR